MKIILSKTKTAIILVLITVILSGFYAYMLARPVSYGWRYYNETVYEGVQGEGYLTFDRNGTVQIKTSNFDETLEYYYFHTNGYLFVLNAKTEDEVIAQCGDGDVFIVQYAQITRKVMDAIPTLKFIGNKRI